MSDLSRYLHDVDAMFDEVDDDIERVAKNFIGEAIFEVVLNSPGPGNQADGTQYVATGRLRASWTYGTQPPATVPVYEHGPFDLDGFVTAERLAAEVTSAPLQPISYAWANVGYAYEVHEGKGNHVRIGPRPWVEEAAAEGEAIYRRARREVPF